MLVGATPELLVRRQGRRSRRRRWPGPRSASATPIRDGIRGHPVRIGEGSRGARGRGRGRRARPRRSATTSAPARARAARTANSALRRRSGASCTTRLGVLDLVAALHPTAAACRTKRKTRARPSPIASRSTAARTPAQWDGWTRTETANGPSRSIRRDHRQDRQAVRGAGIVADSVPEAEVDETERNFRALLDALRWG